MLAIPLVSDPSFALHLGNNVLQLADKLTIYTNGDSVLTAKIREAMVRPNPRITLDSRRIVRLSMKSSDASDVIVTFEDGSTTTEGFIVSTSSVVFSTMAQSG